MRVLDLGCDGKKLKSLDNEVVGLDFKKFPDVDVLHNLEKTPLPFEDESFDMVYMSHSLEHIRNKVNLLNDIRRILKPNGIFKIIMPHRSNPFAWHIEHYTYCSSETFSHLLDMESTVFGFKVIKRDIKLIKPFGWLSVLVNKMPRFYDWYLCYHMPAKEIEFTLCKVEG